MTIAPQPSFERAVFERPAELLNVDFKWIAWSLWAQGLVNWAAHNNPAPKPCFTGQFPITSLAVEVRSDGLWRDTQSSAISSA